MAQKRTASKVLISVLCLLLVSVAPMATPSGAAFDDGSLAFDPRPQNSWGVDGLDPGSGNFQYFSPVFALEQIGDTIYSGGKFLEVTNGVQSHDQPYLAAFDQASGDWVPAFAPDVTWSVFALESDPARNRLFVGGEFPSVNGEADRAGFAALDPVTGAIDADFDLVFEKFGGAQPRVHALEAVDGWLYIGGSFNAITGADGVRRSVQQLARVSLATGAVDQTWTPAVTEGPVWDLAVDAANERVLIGGPFRRVNGEDTAAFAIVSTVDDALTDYPRDFGLRYFDQPGTNYDFASAIAVADNRLLIGGQVHRLVVTDLDLSVISVHRTNRFFAANAGRGGDIQDIVVADDVAFVACHCWGQISAESAELVTLGEYTDVRSTYAVSLDDGQLIESFQPDFSGSSGPWALHLDQDDCLWVGTDATQSGQKSARGVVKLCRERNLAAFENVTATLSHRTGAAAEAGSNAIDGDFRTNDRALGATFAVSRAVATPHLDIDLAELRDIDSIVLWARTDAERLDLQNLHVWLSPAPFPSNRWSDLRADDRVVELVKLGDLGGRRTLSFDTSTVARYVRIEADFRSTAAGVDQLQIAEVAVFGDDAPEVEPLSLVSTLQTRERVVLRWLPAGEVEVFRDGVSLGLDGDGWFTDLGLSAGTSYAYEVVAADGRRSEVITVSTNP